MLNFCLINGVSSLAVFFLKKSGNDFCGGRTFDSKICRHEHFTVLVTACINFHEVSGVKMDAIFKITCMSLFFNSELYCRPRQFSLLHVSFFLSFFFRGNGNFGDLITEVVIVSLYFSETLSVLSSHRYTRQSYLSNCCSFTYFKLLRLLHA